MPQSLSTPAPCHRAAGWPSDARRVRRLHVRDRGPGPRDGVVQLGRVRRAELVVSRRRRAPPATSTLPSGSSVAVWSARGVIIFPVAVQVPLSGSYSWALSEPATRTLPSRSNVAVSCSRTPHLPRPSSRWRSRSRWPGRTAARRRHQPPRAPCRRAATWPGASVAAPLEHAPGGGPGPGDRVVQLGGGQVVARRCHPPRAPGHRGAAPQRLYPSRGVPIVPVAIQTPPGPATGIGLADGAADSLGLGDVASGDAVATAITDGSGTGGTTVGSRRRPEPAASAPPATSRVAQRLSAAPASSTPAGVPAVAATPVTNAVVVGDSAQRVADAIADSGLLAPSQPFSGDAVAERSARESLDSAKALLQSAEKALADARITNTGIAEERSRAEADSPARVPPVAMLFAALVTGLAVGFGCAFVIEVKRPRVADVAEVEHVTDARVIAHTGATLGARGQQTRRQADEGVPPVIDAVSEAYQLLHVHADRLRRYVARSAGHQQ